MNYEFAMHRFKAGDVAGVISVELPAEHCRPRFSV